MQTILYDSPVFGPVHSRRLGTSLGINLLPATGKICTFDCIYCECGLNEERPTTDSFASLDVLRTELEDVLQRFAEGASAAPQSNGSADTNSKTESKLDVITFAGNGEPTAHPNFDKAVALVRELRDRYTPSAKISVLTNGSRAHLPRVHAALLEVDNNIVKLDSLDPVLIERIDAPVVMFDVEKLIQTYASFNGHCIVQTMFLHGTDRSGNPIDNCDEAHVKAWLQALSQIQPASVEVYTIARNTPLDTLTKATPEELDSLAGRVRELGISCSVSY